jgi:hypothetical protein
VSQRSVIQCFKEEGASPNWTDVERNGQDGLKQVKDEYKAKVLLQILFSIYR